MTSPVWITEQDVVDLLDLGEAITALERGLRKQPQGQAKNMVKTHVAWEGSNLHAIGAVFTDDGLAGTKTWAHTPGGAAPLLILIDAATGAVKAIIEAFALGQMRTGGIAGLATQRLAAEGADELGLIGTGKQALLQVAAVNAVRPLRRLRVHSPTASNRRQFIDKVRTEFDFEVIEAESVAAAVADAPIVTLVTRAKTPFLEASMLAHGAHVNAVGAITPERQEVQQDVFERVNCLAVDDLPAVQRLSSELITRFGESKDGWDAVTPLSQIIADGYHRVPTDDITLFKAMGMGISDLALGAEIHARAVANGKGRAFDPPQRVKPRLRGLR